MLLHAETPEPRHVGAPLRLGARNRVPLSVPQVPLAALDALRPAVQRRQGPVATLLHSVFGRERRSAQTVSLGHLELLRSLLVLGVDHGLPLLRLQHPHLVQLLLLEDLEVPLALLLGRLESVEGLALDHGLLPLCHPLRIRVVPPVGHFPDLRVRGGQVVLAHGRPPALGGHSVAGVPRGRRLEGVYGASAKGAAETGVVGDAGAVAVSGGGLREVVLRLHLAVELPHVRTHGPVLLVLRGREKVREGLERGPRLRHLHAQLVFEGGRAQRRDHGAIKEEEGVSPQHGHLLRSEGLQDGDPPRRLPRRRSLDLLLDPAAPLLQRLRDDVPVHARCPRGFAVPCPGDLVLAALRARPRAQRQAQRRRGGDAERRQRGLAALAEACLAVMPSLLLRQVEVVSSLDLLQDACDLHAQLPPLVPLCLHLLVVRAPAHALGALLEGAVARRGDAGGSQELGGLAVLVAAVAQGAAGRGVPRRGAAAKLQAAPAQPLLAGRLPLQRQRPPRGGLLSGGSLLLVSESS
mmetsp:Transcript_79928/g.212130  ORF Transcript_79928/g.212130 Transcript_79928/m.212130 type:complete len:522 (+) Transcript_79928:418-1983(+)